MAYLIDIASPCTIVHQRHESFSHVQFYVRSDAFRGYIVSRFSLKVASWFLKWLFLKWLVVAKWTQLLGHGSWSIYISNNLWSYAPSISVNGMNETQI